MKQTALPGIPASSRLATRQEIIDMCAEILAMLDRQREERASRGLKW